VLVQKSVTTITNFAGRLSGLDARQTLEVSQALACKKMAFHLPERCPVNSTCDELKRYNRLRKTGVKGGFRTSPKQKAAIAACERFQISCYVSLGR